MLFFVIALFAIPFCSIGVIWYFNRCQEKRIKEQVCGLANNTLEMTPEELFEMRKASCVSVGSLNFAGVYILHNKTKNMYYVGQGQQVLNRINAHFTGRGNGDVYADYKYGDVFTIRAIALEQSGFSTLNELERNTIMTYNSYGAGYNKTRGNYT